MSKKILSLTIALLLILTPVFATTTQTTTNNTETPTTTPVVVETDPYKMGLSDITLTSKSAILVYRDPNGNADEILFDLDSHTRREPASITKIMTCLLGLEYAAANEGGLQAGLAKKITATQADFFDITSDSSIANIKKGEVLTFKDLLYCVMVKSANDACNIVAREVAGSVPSFMDEVNARLKAIGANETHYVNPHGLPNSDHYTTAYDIYLMVRECMKNETFMEIAHTSEWRIEPTPQTPEGRKLSTTNKLISSPNYLYPYAKGIKTGSTEAAGHCLCSVAEKSGAVLISVVLGAATEVAEDNSTIVRSFTETKDLFEWGFSNFELKPLIGKKDIVASTKVEQGVGLDMVELVPETPIELFVPKALTTDLIKQDLTLNYPNGITAPVKLGQEMGSLTLSYGDRNFGTIKLVANKAIEQSPQDRVVEATKPITESRWLKWVILGVAGLAVIVFLLVAVTNRKKRRRRNSNYKGRRR